MSGTAGGYRDFGGAVTFGIRGGGNVLAGEGERRGRGRGDGFVAEGQVKFAGFSGDRGIYRRSELKDQARGVVRSDGSGEVGGDVADKETVRFFVQICGPPEETRQDGIEGCQRDQTASIFHEELGGEIGVASLDARAGLADGEFSKDVVVVKTPVRGVGLGADRAQGFEEFEQSDVVTTLALDYGQGIVGYGGIDRKMFFGGRGGERVKKAVEEELQGRKLTPQACLARLVQTV